ncbi:His Kinase A (phospho-acceptor) domain-containing protein [Loktanella atrilutea]|uniref:histidine kinase n=1 Tax=Loktanella atrilutea TaxID=366533 RepID=A0A1M5FVE6_LOKAT|nr:ATP-binding protein [Loktanella atrilutea]SHF95436.1 His Kinase A (phospho-acceptor) domain-containing protein [Loktanella atrilutea]
MGHFAIALETSLTSVLRYLRFRPILRSLANWAALGLATVIIALVAHRLDRLAYANHLQKVRSEASASLLDLRERMEVVIDSQSLVLRELATFIGEKPDITQLEFSRRAEKIRGVDGAMISIAAARDLVVSLIYPLAGNEGVLGFDYRTSAEQYPIVRNVIETDREAIIGPVNLIQGQQGIVLRAPVYLSGDAASPITLDPWGIVSVVLDYQAFMEEVGIPDTAASYDLLIEVADVSGEYNTVFFGDAALKDENPVTLDFAFPAGLWRLYASGKGGWLQQAPAQLRERLIMALAAAALLTVLVVVLRLAESRKRAEALLHNGIEALNDGFVMYDAEDRLILSNEKYRELYNFPRSLLRPGTPFSEILKGGILREAHKLDPEGQAEIMEHRLRSRRAGKAMDFEQHLLNGHVIKVSDRRLPDGGYVGLRVDISELSHAKAAAEAADKAKTDFMGVLSHELRTPLTVILGVARLANTPRLLKSSKTLTAALGADDLSSPQVRVLLDDVFEQIAGLTARMVKSGDHLLHLINEMLDYAKAESGALSVQTEVCAIADIVDPVAEQLITLSQEKGLTFDVVYAPGTVFADADRTRQILFNLVGNAIKFTQTGFVRIIVTTSPVTVDFEVQDSGPGIPAAEIDHIFDAFYQIDSTATRRVGGTGLGLAISRNLAERQGGTLTVASIAGEGSRFRLTLPISSQAQ